MQSTITVRYFAMLRDFSGKNDETVSINAGTKAEEIYLRLAEAYGFPLALTDVRVAVNDEFTSASHPLQDRDVLVFIPPVAGG